MATERSSGPFLLRFHNEDLVERGFQIVRGYFLQGQSSSSYSGICCILSPTDAFIIGFPGCKSICIGEERTHSLSGKLNMKVCQVLDTLHRRAKQ